MGPPARTADRARFDHATAALDPPFAIVDLDAFWHNAEDLRRRAGGKPLRLASKSVRCRTLQERVLESDGFEGTLAFTLPEALWLVERGARDLVVAYPTTDRRALWELSRVTSERPEVSVTVMVDSMEHLDLIDSATGPRSNDIDVCLEVDAGWWLLGGRVRIGAKRSPVHTAEAEEAVTEVAAGSGLFGPSLFSAYRSFEPRPAAFFALPVVRRPAPAVVTTLGGGYVASGPAEAGRLPEPYLPEGLRLDAQEGAGEVQTPLHGRTAATLGLGDRVYFRHAKAGEMCERFDRLYLIEGDEIVDEVPTYRGEGRAFL